MARVWDLDTAREDDGIELSLGLSIGGSGLRKKTVWISSGSEFESLEEKDLRPVDSAIDADASDEANGLADGGDFIDPTSTRERHALRRQEARKKMEEKHMNKMRNTSGSGIFFAYNGSVPRNAAVVDDRSDMEAQKKHCRVRDRAAREDEACRMQRNCKKRGEVCRSKDQDSNGKLKPEIYPNGAIQVMPVHMQYPLQSVQFVPFASSNGSRYRYVMPCWATATSSSTPSPLPSPASAVAASICEDVFNSEKDSVHAEACRSFRPFQPLNRDPPNQSVKQTPLCESDHNDGSIGSSSSVVSDNQSPSTLVGGSSTETRSHSVYSPADHARTHTAALLPKVQSPPHHHQHQHHHRVTLPTHQNEPSPHPSHPPADESGAAKQHEETSAATGRSIFPASKLPPKPTSPIPTSSTTHHAAVDQKATKKKPNRPLLPPSQPPFPRMPCVSATGNGPNGKTVSGFLYRYNKSEISIICVCHGTSFSPEGFVKHAGGTDVSHPLKHIVVVPSLE